MSHGADAIEEIEAERKAREHAARVSIRPSFSSIYMDLARGMSRRSTCRRLAVGCAIVSADFRQVLAVGYNGSASGLANDCDSEEPGKCGCFVEGTRVVASGIERAYRRMYRGNVVRVRLASGREFTATPNHPVLAAGRGWVAAQFVHKGDQLLQPAARDRLGAVESKDDDGVPIEQVFEAAVLAGLRVRRAVREHDFHGDGVVDEEVDVVTLHRGLRYDARSELLEGEEDSVLVASDAAQGTGARRGALRQSVWPRHMRGAFGRVHAGEHVAERGTDVADRYTALAQTSFDYVAGYAHAVGDGVEGFPRFVPGDDGVDVEGYHRLTLVPAEDLGDAAKDPAFAQTFLHRRMRDAETGGDREDGIASLVTPDEVVDVEVHSWAGHVYNLQTASNWYVANGIIAHNCLHAECNAMINCVAPRAQEKIVLVTHLPCVACAKMVVNLGGVAKVIYAEDYRIRDSVAVLERAEIPIVKAAR